MIPQWLKDIFGVGAPEANNAPVDSLPLEARVSGYVPTWPETASVKTVLKAESDVPPGGESILYIPDATMIVSKKSKKALPRDKERFAKLTDDQSAMINPNANNNLLDDMFNPATPLGFAVTTSLLSSSTYDATPCDTSSASDYGSSSSCDSGSSGSD